MSKRTKGYRSTRHSEAVWDRAWESHKFRAYSFLGFFIILPEYIPWDGRYIKMNTAAIGFRRYRINIKLPTWLENKITKNDRVLNG